MQHTPWTRGRQLVRPFEDGLLRFDGGVAQVLGQDEVWVDEFVRIAREGQDRGTQREEGQGCP